jgi:hypothetical protein
VVAVLRGACLRVSEDVAFAGRGMSIMLRDQGSVEGVQFTNITVETLFYERVWWGAAEPIYITAMPRTAQGTVLP